MAMLWTVLRRRIGRTAWHSPCEARQRRYASKKMFIVHARDPGRIQIYRATMIASGISHRPSPIHPIPRERKDRKQHEPPACAAAASCHASGRSAPRPGQFTLPRSCCRGPSHLVSPHWQPSVVCPIVCCSTIPMAGLDQFAAVHAVVGPQESLAAEKSAHAGSPWHLVKAPGYVPSNPSIGRPASFNNFPVSQSPSLPSLFPTRHT